MSFDDDIRRERSEGIRNWANRSSDRRRYWKGRAAYFLHLDLEYLKFLVPPGQRVLALGCGLGSKLAAVEPGLGVGVDLSEKKVGLAREAYPNFIFEIGDIEDPRVISRLEIHGPFDIILLSDTLGFVWDIQKFLVGIRTLCTTETRVISVYYSYLWEPLLMFLEVIRLRMRTFDTTWLRMQDVERFLDLTKYLAPYPYYVNSLCDTLWSRGQSRWTQVRTVRSPLLFHVVMKKEILRIQCADSHLLARTQKLSS